MTLPDPTVIGPPDFRRDQWGRPLIIPPEGGRPRPYTRASSAAKTVEDTYNLELWARRNVAFGMARDRSLVARVLALGGEPTSWDMDTKKECNAIVEDASAVALAHRAADIGTAVHRMTEHLDRGQPVEAGPWEPDIEAYVNALIAAGLSVLDGHIECRLVCDELEVAGSADRILTDGTWNLIADLKTGESADYGGLGWAAQLAAYAHGSLYDPEAGIRLTTPAIDRTVGIIIHLPAGKGTCTLYEIDLVAGYRAAQLANEIRSVRREARRWITPIAAGPTGGERSPSPEPTLPGTTGDGDRRGQLRDRYHRLDAYRQIAFRARAVDRDDLDAVEAALDALEPVAVDPEDLRGSSAIDALNARLLTVTPEQRLQLDAYARQALEGQGTPIVFRYQPHARNVHVCAGLLSCLEAGYSEAQIRILVEAALEYEVQASIPTGAVLGVMTVAEATRFDEMAAQAIPT